MTREEALEELDSLFIPRDGEQDKLADAFEMAIKALEQESKMEQFAKWVASEIFYDDWEYNKDAFDELACRKLAKLGIVRAKGDEWELVEPYEQEE